ncbi:hypothetical protein [Kitasatospora sp. NPDC085464]|uniref:hypothetical protein n=1 Tax=Kitasatospora sp. NPDC085464 TaxID=3364063 RepID=UPI0037C90E83
MNVTVAVAVVVAVVAVVAEVTAAGIAEAWRGERPGTPSGHELVERSVDVVLGREAWLVGGLSEEERRTLVVLLDKLPADVRLRVAGASAPGEDRGDRSDP